MTGEIIQAIGSVGFPIVMCFALFGFIRKEMEKISEALNNNTRVMDALLSKLGGEANEKPRGE